MCDIRYVKESIQTWLLLTEMHNIDTTKATKRLKQLEKRHNRLLNDYKVVLDSLKKDYEDDRSI